MQPKLKNFARRYTSAMSIGGVDRLHTAPLPETAALYLDCPAGRIAEPAVHEGDTVCRYSLLASPIGEIGTRCTARYPDVSLASERMMAADLSLLFLGRYGKSRGAFLCLASARRADRGGDSRACARRGYNLPLGTSDVEKYRAVGRRGAYSHHQRAYLRPA